VRDTVNAQNARTIAVIRARLPYIDRRALSQAWFSALGLHESEQREAVSAARVATQGPSGAPVLQAAAPLAPGVPMVAGLRARRPAARLERTDAIAPKVCSEQRGKAAAPAAGPASRALRYPPVHAAFRLELDGGRVHVVVRREGTLLHVVALCSERHMERVRRALGLAAEHLRLRGEALAAEVRAITGSEGAA